MAKSQADRFSENHQKLADIAKALSHPARVAILEVLATRNVCVCGEVVAEIPLSQATVSQHLKVLLEADLIVGEIDGPKSCYCVNWKRLGQVQSMLTSWFSETARLKADCC